MRHSRRGEKQRAGVDIVRAQQEIIAILQGGGTHASTGNIGYETKKRVEQRFLKPTSNDKLREINPACFDIESKEDDTQLPGFTRPFAIGFYDGAEYHAFRNDERVPCERFSETDVCTVGTATGITPSGVSARATAKRARQPRCASFLVQTRCREPIDGCDSRWQDRHLSDGGCIDKFCRFLFGIDDVPSLDGLKGKDLKAARELLALYQSRRFKIYGHNAGKFDMLFILGWLLRHREYVQFEIVAVQSRIQQLIVWRKGDSRKRCWVFLDSVSLLPMTLEKVGETFCRTLRVCESDTCKGSLYTVTAEKKTCPTCDAEGRIFGKRKMDLYMHESRPLWDDYLRDDCIVLREGLLSYQRMIFTLGGEVGITAPATAMKLFRRSFMKTWIAINKHFAHCDGLCHAANDTDDDGMPVGCSREGLCNGTCHGCLHEFIRKGYYGGRTEVFADYARNALYQDINSSYPASMREAMPVGPATYFKGGSWQYLAKKRTTHIGFVECEVYIPEDCKLPPLPWRVPEGESVMFTQPFCTVCDEERVERLISEGVPEEVAHETVRAHRIPASCGHEERVTTVPEGKLIFPTGHLRGVWDFDELCLVLHPMVKGKIVKIHQSVWFRQEKVFVEFVDKLYAFRNKDDPKNYVTGRIVRDKNDPSVILNEDEFNTALAETCKLMLNSLYGKFGMREERSGLEVVAEPHLGPEVWPENGWPIDGDERNCLLWEVDRIVSAPYIIPQISSHITALSRIRLYYGMVHVVMQGARLYYLDTDSMTCDRHCGGCDLVCHGCGDEKSYGRHRENCDGECHGCSGVPESKALGGWKIESPPHELLSGEFVLPKLYQLQHHKLTCQWALWGLGEYCGGCSPTLHLPKCRKARWVCKECKKEHDDSVFDCRDCSGEVEKVKCKGCAATKQKMKGVGGRYQTPENYDLMVHQRGVVEGERLSAWRTMLNTVTRGELIDKPNHEDGVLLSPVMVPYTKSVRTQYDKRRLMTDGTTRAIHIEEKKAS